MVGATGRKNVPTPVNGTGNQGMTPTPWDPVMFEGILYIGTLRARM